MGKIFDIQRYCLNDGPGIRTTVFFKGCPLNCIWCHNPESQSAETEIMTDNKVCGYEMSADDIIAEVMKDKSFYDNSGGGITLSGGEPLYQFEFCMELLKKSKEAEFHICMETCGFAKYEQIKQTAEYVDIYLYDCKCTNSEKHLQYTGVNNELIIKNLYALDQLGKKIILRLPIIPNYNDDYEHLDGIIEIANNIKNIMRIEIEPYHTFGITKYKKLGRDYKIKNAATPDDLSINKIIEYLKVHVNTQVKKA